MFKTQNMVEVYIYGLLRKMVPESKANEDTILRVESEDGESFQKFIQKLGLTDSRIGDCFINGKLAHQTDLVKAGDRIGLFPFNMRLIDGVMELKYSLYRR